MGQINRIVRGLLSTLDSQTQGQNPSTFGEEIVPIMNMGPGLNWSKGPRVVNNSAAFGGVGLVVDLGPPQGEVWHVHSAGLDLIQLDGFATNWAPGIYFNDGTAASTPVAVQGLTISLPIAAARASVSVVFPEPFQIIQGMSFEAWIQRFSGVPVLGVTVFLTLLVTKYSI